MGLKGSFTIPDSGLQVKNAYVSLYNAEYRLWNLPDNSNLRQYYEGTKPKPADWDTVAEGENMDGKWTLTGSLNVYASHTKRKENKTNIGNVDIRIVIKEMDKPLPEIIYDWLKKKHPDMKDC